MNIVLLGYMGSGKSAIGKFLAKNTDLDFLDLDSFIEEKEGKTIREIFSDHGEVYFRKKETTYLKEVLETERKKIISLGGGTPCYGNNMDLILEATDNVFYLKASIETLIGRLEKEKEQRPLIKDLNKEELPEFIQKHLFERNFYYLRAKHIINVDKKSIETLSGEIQSLLV
ncbi:shikimate kinase [Zhouia amylolytica]|uniref:shikimate kinase n=1 Tax=Zhouia amylolytica TaxID=376730 RepID=UPI0020CEC68B|nr:shikimate kinase [Zhouia amylolytica]MCQ0111883.1 shikimate kinase [Zhouia amylolytica]